MELGELIAGLSLPSAYPHAVEQVEVHQTHISLVLLAGPVVYKIKKPVNLGFVDYTTLERRKHFCEEEVRLNRRLAPSVYLGVVPVCREGSQIRIEGERQTGRMGSQNAAIARFGHAGRPSRARGHRR